MPFRLLPAVVAALLILAPVPAAALEAVFVNPGKSGETFWDMFGETMVAAGRQLGITVEILHAERNYRTMQALGTAVVARERKPDFLILVNEEGAALPILARADAEKVKVLLVSNTLTGEEAAAAGPPRGRIGHWIGSLVPDLEKAGARMATALLDEARSRGLHGEDARLHLLALGGDESTPTSIDRNAGLQRVVAARSDAVVDRLLFARWNRADATQATANFLAWAERKSILLAGVWAGNDAMALGAMDAIAKAGLEPGRDVVVVGLNWSPDALAEIRQGRMLLSDGGHFLGGGWAMVVLSDYAEGCDFGARDTTVRFETAAITRDNVAAIDPVVTRRAFHRIDFARFKASRHGRCGHYDFAMPALLDAILPEVTAR